MCERYAYWDSDYSDSSSDDENNPIKITSKDEVMKIRTGKIDPKKKYKNKRMLRHLKLKRKAIIKRFNDGAVRLNVIPLAPYSKKNYEFCKEIFKEEEYEIMVLWCFNDEHYQLENLKIPTEDCCMLPDRGYMDIVAVIYEHAKLNIKKLDKKTAKNMAVRRNVFVCCGSFLVAVGISLAFPIIIFLAAHYFHLR